MSRPELGRCRLDEILREIGWSAQELADRSDVDKGQISRFLSKKDKPRKISLRDAIAITDTIYIYTGKSYHPRELYEGTRIPPARRSMGES